jgi:hypothetical protein
MMFDVVSFENWPTIQNFMNLFSFYDVNPIFKILFQLAILTHGFDNYGDISWINDFHFHFHNGDYYILGHGPIIHFPEHISLFWIFAFLLHVQFWVLFNRYGFCVLLSIIDYNL